MNINRSQKLKNTIFLELSLIIRVVSKGEYKNCQKKGLKVLFSLRKLFSNFEQLPVNLSCKLFDTLIRPILSYNCEIWYMDEYLPLCRAMLRATRKVVYGDGQSRICGGAVRCYRKSRDRKCDISMKRNSTIWKRKLEDSLPITWIPSS
jgi:hypothetical protein